MRTNSIGGFQRRSVASETRGRIAFDRFDFRFSMVYESRDHDEDDDDDDAYDDDTRRDRSFASASASVPSSASSPPSRPSREPRMTCR